MPQLVNQPASPNKLAAQFLNMYIPKSSSAFKVNAARTVQHEDRAQGERLKAKVRQSNMNVGPLVKMQVPRSRQ
jgi:hypothetical protein